MWVGEFFFFFSVLKRYALSLSSNISHHSSSILPTPLLGTMFVFSAKQHCQPRTMWYGKHYFVCILPWLSLNKSVPRVEPIIFSNVLSLQWFGGFIFLSQECIFVYIDFIWTLPHTIFFSFLLLLFSLFQRRPHRTLYENLFHIYSLVFVFPKNCGNENKNCSRIYSTPVSPPDLTIIIFKQTGMYLVIYLFIYLLQYV